MDAPQAAALALLLKRNCDFVSHVSCLEDAWAHAAIVDAERVGKRTLQTDLNNRTSILGLRGTSVGVA